MGKAQKILQDSAIILQPLWLPRLYLVSAKVEGFEPHPFKEIFAHEIWLKA
jgi:peptide/nickel transport system substrate-binding protein